MSSPATASTEKAPPASAKPKKWFRKRWVIVLALAALLVGIITPAAFRIGIRYGLVMAAKQKGIDLTITKIKGSVFEPVALYGVKVSAFSRNRTMTSIEIARADVAVSLPRIIFRHGVGCLRAVSIDGLEGRVKFEPASVAGAASGTAPATATAPSDIWPQSLIPSRLDATHVNLVFEQANDSVRMENLHFSASDVEPGEVAIEKLMIHQPWLDRTFSGVKGVTAVQNSRISVANLALEKNVAISSMSADLAELANGHLKMDFSLAAFDGSIRGEIKSAGADLRSGLEANGSFSQISVAPLAAFLAYPGESGGVIKEGKFTFNGSLRDLDKATLSLRLEAVDFRLGKRRWNSLVGGAEMVEHRIEIHELHLQQAHNELSLKGRMAFPAPGTEWWQSEFAFDTSAKIDNLTELSTLFGPSFADMAGKITVDGSVKGSNQSFSGDLTLSGSALSYRNAPIDALHAAIHLNGNELQVANLELTSKSDYVRGKGVVNILGQEKRYWGELKASVAELSRYSAILQKPVVPQPLAGGLTVDWSGDGVSKAHSGAFHAQLKKFRLVSVTEPKAHPLNADMEATYSPGNIFFSKFVIWDNDTNFSAKVTAAPKTLNLQSLHLQQGNITWLEGDALLPFNVWSAWENASWSTLLVFDSPCKVNITAKGLDLHETAQLSGRQLPIKGQLDMNLTSDGTLDAIKTGGRVQLKKSQLTLGEENPDVIGADADLVFDGQDLKIEKSSARFNAYEFAAQGAIHLNNLHDPAFDAVVQMKKIPFIIREDVKIDTDLYLNVKGTYGQAVVSGSVQIMDVKLTNQAPNFTGLTSGSANLKLTPLLPFDASQPPLNKWQWDVALATSQPAKILWGRDQSGSGTANFTAHGTGPTVRLTGMADFKGVSFYDDKSAPEFFYHDGPPSLWTVTSGRILFLDDAPAQYALTLSNDKDMAIWMFGQENAKPVFFSWKSPASQREVEELLLKATPQGGAKEGAINGNATTLELSDFSEPAPSSPVDIRAR